MTPDAEGWITWGGGVCPVAPETLVDVRFRDGYNSTAQAARTWSWRQDGDGDDIIAYRIVKEQATEADGPPDVSGADPEFISELQDRVRLIANSVTGTTAFRGELSSFASILNIAANMLGKVPVRSLPAPPTTEGR